MTFAKALIVISIFLTDANEDARGRSTSELPITYLTVLTVETLQ